MLTIVLQNKKNVNKKIKYGNVEDVTVVTFGQGTVSLVNTQMMFTNTTYKKKKSFLQ
jgi:hypothetical protein